MNDLNLIKTQGELWPQHVAIPRTSLPLVCLLFSGGGENIESYLKTELLLQHGSRQVLRAKTTALAGTSFENKPELSPAQDVYLSLRLGLYCSGLPDAVQLHILTVDEQQRSLTVLLTDYVRA